MNKGISFSKEIFLTFFGIVNAVATNDQCYIIIKDGRMDAIVYEEGKGYIGKISLLSTSLPNVEFGIFLSNQFSKNLSLLPNETECKIDIEPLDGIYRIKITAGKYTFTRDTDYKGLIDTLEFPSNSKTLDIIVNVSSRLLKAFLKPISGYGPRTVRFGKEYNPLLGREGYFMFVGDVSYNGFLDKEHRLNHIYLNSVEELTGNELVLRFYSLDILQKILAPHKNYGHVQIMISRSVLCIICQHEDSVSEFFINPYLYV